MRVAAVVLAALLLLAPTAAAETQTASSGTVAATLSFEPSSEYGAEDLRIAVTRAGVDAYDAPVDPKGCEAPSCTPSGADDKAVAVADLDGDGEPEVVVGVYWGGAHCCTLSRILRWNGARYTVLDRNWGNGGYGLDDVDGDGRLEFRSVDDRFAYLYGSYASSVRPVQLFALQAGKLVDVTRLHPDVVRADRARNWRLAQRAGRFGRTAYAAWAADRYLLDEWEPALRTLRRLAARGRLRTDIGDNSLRGQRRWVQRLDRDLRRFGYAG